MSMPVQDIYCDACDFRAVTLVFWGLYEYELPNGERYPLERTTGWCCNCKSFRAIENLSNNINVREEIGKRPPKCLDCGSSSVKPVPIVYPKECDKPLDLDFIHPECGGKMWIVEKSLAIWIAISEEPRRYDINGIFLGLDTLSNPDYRESDKIETECKTYTRENKTQESTFARRKILVVDHDRAVLETLKEHLDSVGYDTHIVYSPEEAIEVLEVTRIDLVITEISMPMMSGLELAALVKKNFDSDIIIMTGYKPNCTYEKTIEIGACDFFYKPIKLKDLQQKVKKIMNRVKNS